MDLLAVQGTLKSLLQHQHSKALILQRSAFFTVQLSHPYMTTGKTIALTRRRPLSLRPLSFFSQSITYFWLCWVLTAAPRPFSSCCEPGLLSGWGVRLLTELAPHCRPRVLGHRGSLVVVHRLSCSMTRGIFPDRGANPCLLLWQADSLPLSHQGGPALEFSVRLLSVS